MDTSALLARSKTHEKDKEARLHAVLPVDTIRPAPTREPTPEDIQDPATLFEYLSPEVRRFAIAMQAKLPKDHEAASLETLHKRLLTEAARLMEAVTHQGVTDRFLRPLRSDHADHNPRRVLNVLAGAAAVACHALRIAQACGALWDPR